MRIKKSSPTKKQGAVWVHKDCYYGPYENQIHWGEAPAAEFHPRCNICGNPFLEGQVVGQVPLKYVKVIEKV